MFSIIPNQITTATSTSTMNLVSSKATTLGSNSKLAQSSGKLPGQSLIEGPKRIIRNIPRQPTTNTTSNSSNTNQNTDDSNQHPHQHQQSASSNIPKRTSPSKKEKDSALLISMEELRVLSEDSNWENRLKSVQIIVKKIETLKNLFESMPSSNLTPSHVVSLENMLDIVIPHLDDAHHKVTTASFEVLELCIDKFSNITSGKLNNFLFILFHRLSDRRPHIKNKANDLLNNIKKVYDPVTIVSSIAPRLAEISDRVRASVLQFLIVIAPYTSSYFSQSQNASLFLNRISSIFSAPGVKPSMPVITSINRLIFNTYYVYTIIYYINDSIVIKIFHIYYLILTLCNFYGLL